jgi:hypothetical protein
VRSGTRVFEVPVKAGPVLELPGELAEALGLVPGDLLSLEPAESCLCLEIYREHLTADWRVVSPENRWGFLSEFLSRSLTAVEPGGRLPIPPDLLPLGEGEAAVLHVLSEGHHPRFLLFWDRG